MKMRDLGIKEEKIEDLTDREKRIFRYAMIMYNPDVGWGSSIHSIMEFVQNATDIKLTQKDKEYFLKEFKNEEI